EPRLDVRIEEASIEKIAARQDAHPGHGGGNGAKARGQEPRVRTEGGPEETSPERDVRRHAIQAAHPEAETGPHGLARVAARAPLAERGGGQRGRRELPGAAGVSRRPARGRGRRAGGGGR